MAMVLTFHQTSIDMSHVKRMDQPWRAPFFDAQHYLDGSARVTELSEQQIVRWILLSEPARRLLFNQLGFPASVFYKPEVMEPFFDQGKGDIDLVLCNPHRPQETAAVEIKRVKVAVIDNENDKLNKLENTREGVGQANRLYNKFGFFQSYLGIVSAIDASLQSDFNVPCRGINSASRANFDGVTTFKRIVEFPGREDLNSDVGIVFVELVQPSGISINKRVTIRVCVHQAAKPRTQSTAETNRVAILLQRALAN